MTSKLSFTCPEPRRRVVAALAFGLAVSASIHAADPPPKGDPPAKGDAAHNGAGAVSAPARPSLSVTLATPLQEGLPQLLSVNGNIAAWQEVIVGAETQGLRIVEVHAQVGDKVKRGQLLARLSTDTLAAEVAATRANLAEAEAAMAEAQANAERARQLQSSGAISAQQIQQYTTLEATARARGSALRARLRADEVRLAQARIAASDDGVISARTATVGAIAQPGQEMFRLIRGGRLEWRAEVPATDLAKVAPGMVARVTAAGGEPVQGKVRMVAPTVDAATRNGIVYVDLEPSAGAKAGMFARGDFDLGGKPGLTLPQNAVLLRDGFAYVFMVGADNKVAMTKVTTGRRVADRVEVTSGLDAGARVVASGVGFLADGDTVRVVNVVSADPAAKQAAPKPASK
jgi:HlyD family secretion protein